MEENRKGPGVFYAVVGVATLVVAIIGATFAFFSAQATPDDSTIGGETETLANALQLSVTKVDFTDVIAEGKEAASNNLVPTDVTGTTTDISAALAAGCVADNYTGCHVYKIQASSTTEVATSDLKIATLGFDGTAPKDTASWKYVVFKGTETENVVSAATGLVGEVGTFSGFAGTTIHNTTLNATPSVYYLMVYIANDAENAQDAGNDKDVTGTYTGSVTLTAAGGAQVAATFSS